MEQIKSVHVRAARTKSRPIARRLSWSIVVFSVAIAAVGLLLGVAGVLASDGEFSLFSHLFFFPIFAVTYGGFGGLVAARHPRHPIGWLLCVVAFFTGLMLFSAGYRLYDRYMLPAASLPASDFVEWLSVWTWMVPALLPLTFLLLLFPDGRLPGARWRPIAWAAGLGVVGSIAALALQPDPQDNLWSNPYALTDAADAIVVLNAVAGFLLLIGILGSIASVVIRFRRSEGIERAQLKWLAYAGLLTILVAIASVIIWAALPDNPLAYELTLIMTHLLITSIIAATAIAILRYRLYDIDILINRTLVYTALTALIVAIYVVMVGSLGTLLQTGGSLPVSLFATGIVAISFQPLRERLQRGVNRLMYGERDEPYAVLGRLAQRLEVVVASQSVLPTIVETVADALKLPYAAIALRDGAGFRTAAEYTRSPLPDGDPGSDVETLPLAYQSESIGQLILAQRAPGEVFSQADRQLLETIARQAGIAAYNVRLTQDLQRSRERLVTTREEERRRLRRDLHDGLGPQLASMSFRLDAIGNLIETDPQTAHSSVIDLKSQVQIALGDIRRIAYGLRPPALDELGLVGALKEHIAAHNQAQGLQITLETPEPLPPLPAAVEVAAYRIALEALTNVSRHAGARTCDVRLSLSGDLYLEVCDDGCGIPAGVRAGVGLSSMRERAEELGGKCIIEPLPDKGSRVLTCLPLSSAHIIEESVWRQSES